MLTFLRKIRRQLLAENRFSRYLIYAVGEILLVVAGILIAVRINANYTEAENEEKVNAILTQIQQEILTDIADANRIQGLFFSRDSLSRLIIEDRITVEDYMENPWLLGFLRNYVSFSNQRGGYERLMNNLEIIPEKYAGILPELNFLYVELQNDIDDFNVHIKEAVMDEALDRSKVYADLVDHMLWKNPEEDAAFFLNDPFLKNRTQQYINRLGNITSVANEYRFRGTHLIHQIDSLLGKPNASDSVALLQLNAPLEMIAPYLGSYTRTGGLSPYGGTEVSILVDKGILRAVDENGHPVRIIWHEGLHFFPLGRKINLRFFQGPNGEPQMEISSGWTSDLFTKKADDE